MLTRWDPWYSKENLSMDERIMAAPPSQSAIIAATKFVNRGKHRILDLACGVGRDTFHLEEHGLSVVGADASLNGLSAAYQNGLSRGSLAQFVTADARYLPFDNGSFEGVYSFGLLHEFTGDDGQESVKRVVSEVKRVLVDRGLFVLTVLKGEPQAGLPDVQLFNRSMFDLAMAGWEPIEVRSFDDVGCTNRPDYHIWYGAFEK
jgi:ubiquinone/menaquinone biosynthesis C-methylase UbiE